MPGKSTDTQRPATTPEDELTEARFLEEYKKKEYPKPSVTADIAVFRRTAKGIEVLLIRRGKHPYRNCWALPGGFVDPNEDVIDAAHRELEEETGVVNAALELFGIYGTPGRDPRGWTVSGGFCTLIDENAAVKAGDDAADAQWCAVDEAISEEPSQPHGEIADEPGGSVHTISVRCSDSETLSVRFRLAPQQFGAPRAHLIDGTGFAFDHAQLFADAYLKITS